MHIVAENTPAELAKREAMQDLRWQLRPFAANLLRVVRGAGRPGQIAEGAAAVLAALNAYYDVAGIYPSSYEISEALAIDGPRGDDGDWSDAFDTMMRGCLQMAAASLLDQSTHKAAGRSEMMEGFKVIEAIRERNRLGRGRKPVKLSDIEAAGARARTVNVRTVAKSRKPAK